uniref:DNA ligase ATP-dependent N-terminal domain-containing protein n=1 Tax=Parascaris equorum TaxID=6256 RepID=A0A914RG02_PAREQ
FDSFKLFCKLCEVLASVSKYTDKSTAVNIYSFVCSLSDGYDGDMLLLVRMLLPSTDQRVFNLKEKQLIKLFSNVCSIRILVSMSFLNTFESSCNTPVGIF